MNCFTEINTLAYYAKGNQSHKNFRCKYTQAFCKLDRFIKVNENLYVL
jgi:hypothetical protein